MAEAQAGKSRKWIWALLAAVVLVALVAWWVNRGAEGDEELATNPAAQEDASGVAMGSPNPPAVSAAEASEGPPGDTSSGGVPEVAGEQGAAAGTEGAGGAPAASAAGGTTPQ